MKVERLGFPILKMVHNPGGDWNPGWGVDLKNPRFYFGMLRHKLTKSVFFSAVLVEKTEDVSEWPVCSLFDDKQRVSQGLSH